MKTIHRIPRLIVLPCVLMLCTANADSPTGNASQSVPNSPDLAQQAQDKLQQAASPQDFEDAASMLKQAAKANPNDYDVRLTLGWVYLDKLHKPEAAYEYLDTVVKHSPNDVNARKLLGLASMQTGRSAKAVDQFRAASKLQPDDPWIRAYLGRSLARVGDYSRANKIFDDVLKTDPGNADARRGKAEVAAWEGRSETALEALRSLKAENATNAEVMTLMGDIHRWKWKLSEAEQDYRAALAVDTNNYAALTGLKDAETMGSSQIGGNAYYFQDTTKFLREYAGGTARIHLTDQAYLIGSGTDWRFNSPGVGNVFRADGSAGMEYHWTRWLETSLVGDIYNYNNRDAIWGGELSSKISPMHGVDIYTTINGQQPFVSSIATVTNGLKQNSIGNGLDIKLFGPISFQNNFQVARISDGNTWWEDKPQLSWNVFKVPETFIRVEYDHLSYSHTNGAYWSPHDFNIVSPVLDVTIPICKGLRLVLDGRAPYVTEASQWGYIFEGGPAIELFNRVQIKASYYKSFIPRAWSGEGGQASLSFRF